MFLSKAKSHCKMNLICYKTKLIDNHISLCNNFISYLFPKWLNKFFICIFLFHVNYDIWTWYTKLVNSTFIKQKISIKHLLVRKIIILNLLELFQNSHNFEAFGCPIKSKILLSLIFSMIDLKFSWCKGKRFFVFWKSLCQREKATVKWI